MAPDGHPYTIRLNVTNLTAGVSYKIYRGELIPILSNTNGDWVAAGTNINNYQFTAYDTEPVHTWTGERITADTSASFVDTGIVPRKSYIYKLVSVVPGATPTSDIILGDGSTATVFPASTQDAGSVYSRLALTVIPLVRDMDGLVQLNDTERGKIHAELTNYAYTKDVSVRLYYRRAQPVDQMPLPDFTAPGATITGWTEITTPFEKYTQTNNGDEITDESGIFKPLEIAIPNPVYGEDYQFRAIAYLNGVAMPNLNNTTYASAGITVATAESALSTSQVTGWGSPAFALGTVGNQTLNGITGYFLDGAPIYVRIVRDTPLPGKFDYYDLTPDNPITFSEGLTASTYRIQLTLSPKPEPNEAKTAGGSPTQDFYSIIFRYPWETWENLPAGRTIQSGIPY
jgi:hypothetical protein